MIRSVGAVSMAGVLAVSACSTDLQVWSMDSLPHVHNVVIVDDEIYLGSHEGLYRFSEEDGFHVVSPDFDVMGLAFSDEGFYASGHPGPGFDYPDPVGLLVSSDRGATWDAVSLTGEVDFHLLDASGDTIIGAAANYGVLIMSDDSGQTWGSVDWPPLYDFGMSPTNPDHILIATGEGLMVSVDAGQSFTQIPGAPEAIMVQWSPDGIVLATPEGLFIAGDLTGPFTKVYSGLTRVIDVAMAGSTIAVVDGHSLLISRDSGQSFIAW